MTKTKEIRRSDKGPLHDLLLLACPPNADGKASIKYLAEVMCLGEGCFYTWTRAGIIPRSQAHHIVSTNNLYWLRRKYLVESVEKDRIVCMADFEPYIKIIKEQSLL